MPINTAPVEGGFLTGKKLIYPISLVISLFFLWGFSYGLLDVLNKHFQDVYVSMRPLPSDRLLMIESTALTSPNSNRPAFKSCTSVVVISVSRRSPPKS